METVQNTTCPECGNTKATVEYIDGVYMMNCPACGYYHSTEVDENIPTVAE